MKEAARYSSIGTKRLKALAVDKKILGVQDPDSGRNEWIFDRHSIDDYRTRQMTHLCGHLKKASEILQSVGSL
jgi:hypothetical protein